MNEDVKKEVCAVCGHTFEMESFSEFRNYGLEDPTCNGCLEDTESWE
jgi:hypothetical protein